MRRQGMPSVMREAGTHDNRRRQGTLPAGPGRSAVPYRLTEPAVGFGSHRFIDLQGWRR